MANIQFGSGNINSGNVTNSYNNTITLNGTDGEDDRIKQWLSQLEPWQRHQSVQTSRVDGVGDWFLEEEKFRDWSGSQGALKQPALFCYGDPGVGKTHISSLVIDSLCDQARNGNITVAGLYCDYLAREGQSVANMLGAILKQLLERDGIPESLRRAFRNEKRGFGGRAVQLSSLVEILKTTIASLPQVFICIDALDECLPNNRQDLLESLQEIVRVSPTTRVFLSGRPHIHEDIKRYFTQAITIQFIPSIGDIEKYLEMRLARDTATGAMDDDLRAEIMRVISGKISQIFLLVSLNIDAVLEEVTIHKRRKKLDEMTQGNGLQDAYSATFARIEAQKGGKSRIGIEVLMWLSHSERPLEANELRHALGVEIGSTDLNPQNIPTIETLVGCSLGLVAFEVSSSTVRLVHYTLHEYLSDNTKLFHSPHSKIADVCLTYLNFEHVRNLSAIRRPPRLATPFLGYASCYWATHAEREMTESVNPLALKLLHGFDKHVSCGFLLYLNDDFRVWGSGWCNPRGFTGLHGAAYLGLVQTTIALLEMGKWDLNATDVAGNTPILWAVKKGHSAIVETLLARKDVAPDAADESGRTPLSWAAGGGHKEVLKMLLERDDVTPNTANEDGRTPLSWAASFGYKSASDLHLQWMRATYKMRGRDRQTRSSWAARDGHGDRCREIVEILLKREDVTPEAADGDGRTTLSWAVEFSNEEVVKMLLKREDVAPDAADRIGRTPLSWAAWFGSKDVVRMLLDLEDVAPDTQDRDGRTPLSWAARFNNGEVVQVILEQGDVTPDIADREGRTPLSWAARFGNEEVVEMLLGREDVAPDTADRNGRTPFSWAIKFKNGHVTKMLLERGGVAPCAADRKGRTPLLWAAKFGNEDIIRILLEREDVAPDTADERGRTPLSRAAGGGHWRALKILLEREDVAPDTKDKEGRTPLSWAASFGYEHYEGRVDGWITATSHMADDRPALSTWAAGGGCSDGCRAAVEILLEREDVAPDSADKAGRTPLSWAAEFSNEGVVKILLERRDVSPNTPDEDGRTPLWWAATLNGESGDEDWGVGAMLLKREDITPSIADKNGCTPLMWAAFTGVVHTVKMLLERGDVTPDARDKSGRTPLSWAASRGHGGVVKMLLEREDVTPDTADKNCRTPLSWAAGGEFTQHWFTLSEHRDVTNGTPSEGGRQPREWKGGEGHADIARMILERGDVAQDAADKSGRTPLSWAAGSWRQDGGSPVVKILLEWGVVADSRDKDGRTPLSWAAGLPSQDAVNILLERNDVAPDAADEAGRTPLSWGAGGGSGGIVRMLLKRGAVADSGDRGGRTPLSWAASFGRGYIVQKGFRVRYLVDGDLQILRTWPAKSPEAYQFWDVVEILLGQKDVTPDTADRNGRTALSWAADFGNENVVGALLGREDVAPNTPDRDGRTPLWWAVERGHTRVVKMLLARCDMPRENLMTDLTHLTASTRTSRGVAKRPFRDQGSVPQSAGSTSSKGLSSAKPSVSSSALTKSPGDLETHDKSPPPDESSRFRYHANALLNLALDSPLLVLLLSLLFILLLHILVIYLRTIIYPVIAFLHP